jgi:hypothetical protein
MLPTPPIFAGDLASCILYMADSALRSTFVFFFLAFSRSAGVTQRLADFFFDGASGLLHPSRDSILVHLQFLTAIAEFALETR